MTKQPPPSPRRATTRATSHHLHVLPPRRIQPSRLRTTTRPVVRRRRPVLPAHQRIRVISRDLPAVPVRTRRPSRTPLPGIALRALLALRSHHTLLALNPLRPGVTLRPDRTILAIHPGRA